MANFFLINGYFKDDNSEFTNFLVVDSGDTIAERDDDIFFYGLSESEIKEAIDLKEDTAQDFVITSYEHTN